GSGYSNSGSQHVNLGFGSFLLAKRLRGHIALLCLARKSFDPWRFSRQFEKLLDIHDSMSKCAASAAPTSSATQKLARHRDILHEYIYLGVSKDKKELYINSKMEHADELLTSVRDDIGEYKVRIM
ncbi:hypothetical protein DY000_02061660, partial [Brassica cretica]